MKRFALVCVVANTSCATLMVSATTRYVDLNNLTPASPYTAWSNAAVNIQDAIDAASPGDRIIVTNGIYDTGGRVVIGLTNRVVVDKAVTVESAMGPHVTIIRGFQVPGTTNGPGAIRCVYLGSDAVLSGFTLTNGATAAAGFGGGVYSEPALITNCVLIGNSAFSGGGSFSGILRNCTVMGNTATSRGGGSSWSDLSDCVVAGNLAAGYGGGVDQSTLSNCILRTNISSLNAGGASDSTLNACWIVGNTAYEGGAAMGGTLNNCVVHGNAADFIGGAWNATLNNCTLTGNAGGGAAGCNLNNCIIYFNSGWYGWDNWTGGTLNYCCTTPLPTNGLGNFDTNPQLASVSHIGATSPCRGAGSPLFATGSDIDSDPWASPPSIGCDEYSPGAVTGALDVAVSLTYTNLAVGCFLDATAMIKGRTSSSLWDFGDGQRATNQAYCSHGWLAPGNYRVILTAFNESNPGGVSATSLVQVVSVPVYYVAPGSPHPEAPYASWATAAADIQSALDASIPGALILVSNGVYETGGRAVLGTMTNRVAIDKPVSVRSVNGPTNTIIQGYQIPGTYNGDGAIRCVYLTNRAELSGFTLTGGATRAAGNIFREQRGGGAWCEFRGAILTNCVIIGNQAFEAAAGAAGGTLNNSVVLANIGGQTSIGGGTFFSLLNYCTVANNSALVGDGGGSFGGTLNYCTIANNSAYYGGGTDFCTLNNCALYGNSATSYGGGANRGTLNQCTLSGNQARFGGGAYQSALTNCIAYFNTASSSGSNYESSSLSYCCTTPMPTNGIGNITNAPLFVDMNGWANLRLQSNSPCINAGSNLNLTNYYSNCFDLDSNSRIVAGTVDIGAYEFQFPVSSISYAWLQQYGLLPATSSTDQADLDGDGLNNWQEWIAGTDPTDATSRFQLFAPILTRPAVLLTWNSDTYHAYFIQRAASSSSPLAFTTIATNILGLPAITTFRDPAVLGETTAFYRVGTFSTTAMAPFALQQPAFITGSVTITWTSVTNRLYFVQRAINLSLPPAFSTMATNIQGQSGTTTTFTDNAALFPGPIFYRVGVQQQ